MATNTLTTGLATGLINITGGIFTSNVDITKGGGTGTTATVTLNGGTLDMGGKNIGSRPPSRWSSTRTLARWPISTTSTAEPRR